MYSPSMSPSSSRCSKHHTKLQQSSVLLGNKFQRVKWGPVLVIATVIFLLCYLLWFRQMIFGKDEDDGAIDKSLTVVVPPEEYNDVLNNKQIPMDDPRLVHVVKKILIPPSTNRYNFEHKEYLVPGANPSAGQVQAVADILKGFGADGFFVECGANDGEWYSNTVWLERTLGWKGLLIEADPSTFALLAKKNRNAWMGHFCISNYRYPYILPFYQAGLGSGLIKSKNYNANTAVNVQCVPLYTVLLALNRTTVDFFSLDVEGSEIDILKTVPFDKVIFKVITIEHVVLKEGKVGLRKFMESHGYIFYRTVVDQWFLTGDSVFIHNSVVLTPEQKAKIGVEDSLALRLPRE